MNPSLFQGVRRRGNYFEGWYFKMLNAGASEAAAVIPGISLGNSKNSPDSHAFVQFITGESSQYFRYPLEAFESHGAEFRLRVANNLFDSGGVSLDLRSDACRVAGKLEFRDTLPFPKTPLCPGIMGPFGFVPGMECYHGIVSFRHGVEGCLSVDGRPLCFDGGSGYIEKDWGRSFPRAWAWLQANRFLSDAAFLFSAAEIPWLGRSFRGFFAFLHLDGKLHRFATYTGARLVRLAERGGSIEAVIVGRNGRLEIEASPGPGGTLKAPKNGRMDVMIEESIRSNLNVRLTDAQGLVVFEDTCEAAAMEKFNSEELYIK
jgi:tocopherol cyclase